MPLIIDSNGPRMLEKMAEHPDGWNTVWVMDPVDLIPLDAAVDAACEAAGREPASLFCIFIATPHARGR